MLKPARQSIEIGNLYRVRGTVTIRTDDGYLMGAYAYYPKFEFYEKDTLWNEQPLIMNDTIVLVVDVPQNIETDLKTGVHVLVGNRVQYMFKHDLVSL